ncbi:amidohydrolase family protein [Kitasatospora sp. NPDC050543]|uniref:amidohydrolase family protein n=1 Tax=Kitasatospora sp. NPDC050543 TaxID=3364054 RepID=UPI00378AEA5B
MIFDCHQHVILPTSAQIAAMDEAGIDRTVLLSTLPHIERAGDIASFKQEMSVLGRVLQGEADGREKPSAELREALAEGGERFVAFGKVPVGLPYEDTVKALQQEVLDPGYAGVGELTFGADEAAGLEPVFRAVAEAAVGSRALPLLVHGFAPQTAGDIRVTADLARRFPSVPVVVGVLGGLNWLETIELVKEIPNLYLDLASSFVSLAPRLAAAEIPERCLFGSNTPFADMYSNRVLIERMVPDRAARDRVMGENLAELLGLAG